MSQGAVRDPAAAVKDLGVDVCSSPPAFHQPRRRANHIAAGARRSHPRAGQRPHLARPRVNDELYEPGHAHIISNSCTTPCAASKVLHRPFASERGCDDPLYTTTSSALPPHQDRVRAWAAGCPMITRRPVRRWRWVKSAERKGSSTAFDARADAERLASTSPQS